MHKTIDELFAARQEAEFKAWDSLSRYKFMMFGYWAACFVKFNRILAKEFVPVKNPFKSLVDHARFRVGEIKELQKTAEEIKKA
jgi:hypothetical protein